MSESSEDREKELKGLTLKFEIEKQKNRKLEQELDILKQKLEKLQTEPKAGPAYQLPGSGVQKGGRAPHAPSVPGAPSRSGGDTDVTQFIDKGLIASVAGVELQELQAKLDTLTDTYKQSEQEKWDVARKNIEFKEEHQRLKVKGINLKKDIEGMNEKLDRKENQNFKSRLEISDLKKDSNRAEEHANDSQKQRENLEAQIADIERRLEKERQKLKEEKRARDLVHSEYQRQKDMLAEYETHWAAKIYNR